MSTLRAVRGTRDLLPPETQLWNHVDASARALFARYGFGEIRTPVFEATELFARGVGEETDIVSKEMYTWEDRARAASARGQQQQEKAQSLTLRPENTAGVVRAYIEHKLGETGSLQKLFYIGPQFRRERPQRGRYRQFWQIGAEVLGPTSSGSESPLRDAEILEMLASLLDELGVQGWRLELNSVGSSTDRPRYVAALREALAPIKHRLCEDNQRRADTNPLRVLDSKAPEDQELINGLPKIADFLDDASRDHFAQVLAALDACGVPYAVNPRLVRGLDYYTRTTFEFTVPDGSGLGTQNALLGGGRYDGLSEMLGGPKAPGIGFAIGEDRLMLTLQAQASVDTVLKNPVDVYLAPLGKEQNAYALSIAKYLRNVWRPVLRRKGFSVEVGEGNFRLKKSFEIAEKMAPWIVILGEEERATNSIKVKEFASGEQLTLSVEQLVAHLAAKDQPSKDEAKHSPIAS